MNKYSVLLVAGIAALSSSVSAKDTRGGYCQLNGLKPDFIAYRTGAMAVNAPSLSNWEAARALTDEIRADLAEYLRQRYGINALPEAASCEVVDSVAEAEARIGRMPRGPENVFTGWVRKAKANSVPNANEKLGEGSPSQKPKTAGKVEKEAGPTSPTAAEKHRAVEERNRAAQAQYEADLADRQRKVDEFNRLTAEMERKKAEQSAAAQAALAAHDAQLAAAAEAQRKHEADLAKYEREVAAQKVRNGFDERHELGQASTDTDANRCVTYPETQLNASFKGNTAASVINGCGKPVDVRICLMTDKGWNCGVTYGLGSQQRWSHSSFNATGSVFSDARTSGSSRPLASPK